MIGGEVRYFLISWNASFVSSVQTKGSSQKLEEWESLLSQSRDKPAQCNQASRELLHVLDVGRRPHCFDCLDLLCVGPNPPVCNQETEELARGDPEHTFVRAQLGTGQAQPVKNYGKIDQQRCTQFNLDNDVMDIHFYQVPN
jgi:hypothetical protein